MAFSRRMQPHGLAGWLLDTYGESYSDDIGKLESNKINGELFLELEEDEELLKDLNLSLGFKKLVKKKAKELKQQSNGTAVDNGHTPPQPPSSNGQSNGGAGSNGQSNGTSSGTSTQAAQPKPQAQEAPAPVATALGIADRLTPAHLSQVLDLVWEARTKYYGVGLELQLPSDTIDAIEKSSAYRVETIYTEMIKECLKLGLVTQEKLADAVSSRQVGFQYLSTDILAKKFTVSKTQKSAPPAAVATDADFDKYEVKNHLVSRLEWIDWATREKKTVRVYNKVNWRWKNVATNLGLEPGEIESMQRNNSSDDDRVTAVFRQWFDNANNLPNKDRYPKKWSGLIRLLDDSDLGELSKEVKTALSAASSNVRGTLQ